MIIDRTFRDIERVLEIGSILLKYGFDDFLQNIGLKSFITNRRRLSFRKSEDVNVKLTRWERLRLAAEELGPTFIKLAQALSNRPDILPAELIKELQKLQSEVPAFSYDTAKVILEDELGKTIEEVFEEFYKKPIGSASIGQVHRARLHNGENVVVKIQRPGVRKKVETDLDILKILAKWGEVYLERQGLFNAVEVVETFERSLMKELDYHTEARFMEQFAAYYRKNKKFKVPKVYKHLSTGKILVQEFIRGAKITDTAKMELWGLEPAKIAERGIDIYMSQIFEHGYFHADPHPGNIIIQEDGTLCLIDFGMVGRLSKRDRFAFAGILIGMAKEDATMVARNYKRLAISYEIEDDRAFVTELEELIEDFGSLDIGEVNMADLANRLQEIIRDYKMRMPGGVFIIMRALTILEGIGKTIHPEFNSYDFFRPYGLKLLKQIYSPENLMEEFISTSGQFSSFLTSFPVEVKEILEKTRKGSLRVELMNLMDEYVVDKFNRAANRIVIAILTFGIYLAASITLVAYTQYHGPFDIVILILSIIGYVFATLFTVSLLIGSWWSTR